MNEQISNVRSRWIHIMIPDPISLRKRVLDLTEQHGGLRAASRATDIDVAYLKRLRDGEKSNPSNETLERMGLKSQVYYYLA